MHLAVVQEELKHCIVREPTSQARTRTRAPLNRQARAAAERIARGTYKLLPMVSFGSKGAPLVWSGIAAAIGRMTAAILR